MQDDRFPRAQDETPTRGDGVAMDFDESVEIRIAEVSATQHNLAGGVWTIVDAYGEQHMIEDDGSRWVTVNPALRGNLVEDPADAATSFHAQFEEDGASDGQTGTTRHWRGVILERGEPSRSTACLYADPAASLLAALRLRTGEDPLA